MKGKYITFYEDMEDKETKRKWIAKVKYKIIRETGDLYICGEKKHDRLGIKYCFSKSDENKLYQVGRFNTSNSTRE